MGQRPVTGQHSANQEADRTEEFLGQFFGEGNDAGQYPEIIEPFTRALSHRGDSPLVLPRYIRRDDRFTMYVVPPDGAQIIPVADLIEAFAGPTYCTEGDTYPAQLNPDDPVEAALAGFTGQNEAFVIQAGRKPASRAQLRGALALMQAVAANRPTRLWHVPKPLGRLLAEFDAALAAGGEAASKSALDQLAAQGGITATNLTHLRIKRLDRLGRSEELMAMPGLANVLMQDPPLPVKEAILNAIYSTILDEPLGRGDVASACGRLRDAEHPISLPAPDDIDAYGDQAAAVLLTAAIGRRDIPALRQMATSPHGTGRSGIPHALWHEALKLLGERTQTPPLHATPDLTARRAGEVSPPAPAESPIPASWPTLFAAVAANRPQARAAVLDETWREWPSPAETDEQNTHILDTLDDAAWTRTWRLAGPLIEAVGYGKPALHTARAFVTYALAFDQLGPGDLVALQALTEICLRASPPAPAYRDLLGELRDSCPQWVSPETALVALDFADRLVLAACPDENARTNLALALLKPLHRRQGRLEDPDLAFARQLSEELRMPLVWQTLTDRPVEETPLADVPALTVLLYSLDQAVLDRTAAELKKMAPALKVATSHDKVATDSLRSKARTADVVALATRCAKHAATGFITENARSAVITYADGSGSASLLRATVNGLVRAGGG
jgi:hypothetical protein